jgi:midasin (ATPase involved in ribosome maturation)
VQKLILGKTTLIAALAKAIGKPLTRINLSEQTDLMDLFGSDVPVSDIVRFLMQKMKEEAQKLMGAS